MRSRSKNKKALSTVVCISSPLFFFLIVGKDSGGSERLVEFGWAFY